MTRQEQRAINRKTIIRVVELIDSKVSKAWWLPIRYKAVIAVLNSEGLKNSRGKAWRMKTLYEMLARNGFGGLHGLKRAYRASVCDGQDSSIFRHH